MRIERIHADAFGRFRSFDSGADALGPLVVVLGPNEAGKSTLFEFLTTALYGFHPASRERNPLVPWGEDEAGGGIRIVLSDGEQVKVERRLRSAPSGTVTRSGAARELRNHPVPWASHVPRAVFRQVFAVTLADLAALDDQTWAGIQDRIVGSMGSSDLRPARAVADELEQEASQIWRPNRRGNQRLRDVQDAMRGLRARRAEALERDRAIRGLVEERDNVLVRLRELRSERQEHKLAIERIRTLVPVRLQLARIDALRSEGGPRQELLGLPADPVAVLRDTSARRDRLQRRLADLGRELSEPEAALARYDDGVRGLLDRVDDIARFRALAARVAPERTRIPQLRADIDRLDREVRATAAELLDGGWRHPLGDTLASMSPELLADRVRRWAAAAEQPVPPRQPEPALGRAGLPAAAAGALVVGLAALAWGVGENSAWALVLGTALVTGAAAAGLTALRSRRHAPKAPPPGAPGEAERARAEIERMLEPLPVRGAYLDPPGQALVDGVTRLRAATQAEADRRRALEEAQRRVEEADAAAHALARSFGRNGTPDAESLAETLDRDVREAERIREAARAAERERARLMREQEHEREELDAVAHDLARLTSELARRGDGDAVSGARAAEARLHAHRRADELAQELERSHANLSELTVQIRESERAGESWTVDDGELARRRAHVEHLDDEIERVVASAEALERDAAHLRELDTVDAVDSEIATLQEAEARLARERDRKWLLALIVREADRRFREEHQPDLVRRASAHFRHLTGGRYERLLIDETHEDGPFQIVGAGLPAPVPLRPPVSTGTLEQAYLSLRLAIVDHLDPGPERLPLFVDEVFVNWDRARRDRGLDVLADLSAKRQLFVFTCHPEMAERLGDRGADVIRLEPGR